VTVVLRTKLMILKNYSGSIGMQAISYIPIQIGNLGVWL